MRGKSTLGMLAAAVGAGLIALALWAVVPTISPFPTTVTVLDVHASASGEQVELEVELDGASIPDAICRTDNMPDMIIDDTRISAESAEKGREIIVTYSIALADLPVRNASFSKDSKIVFDGYDGAEIASKMNTTAESSSSASPKPSTAPDQEPQDTNLLPSSFTYRDLSEFPEPARQHLENTVKTIFRDASSVVFEGLSDGGDGAYMSVIRSDDSDLDGATIRYNEQGTVRSLVKDGIDYMS